MNFQKRKCMHETFVIVFISQKKERADVTQLSLQAPLQEGLLSSTEKNLRLPHRPHLDIAALCVLKLSSFFAWIAWI